MKLVAAEFAPFRMPLAVPLVTSKGRIEEREGFILSVFSESGDCGRGEASPPYWIGGEQIDDTHASLESIVASVGDLRDTAQLRVTILSGPFAGFPITPAAASALDTALLDLAARKIGVSLASLLGAKSNRSVPVCALLAGRTPNALAREAKDALESGYPSLKLKVGADALAVDLKNLDAIRSVADHRCSLRLDANGAWSFEEAQAASRAFQAYEIEFIEEPLREPLPDHLRHLRDTTGICIALDESISSKQDFERFSNARALDHVVLKAARIGGPQRTLELARLAAASGVKVVVTDSIETRIGMSIAIHLAAALSTPEIAVGLGGSRFLRAPAGSALSLDAAAAYAPCGPGLDVAAGK